MKQQTSIIFKAEQKERLQELFILNSMKQDELQRIYKLASAISGVDKVEFQLFDEEFDWYTAKTPYNQKANHGALSLSKHLLAKRKIQLEVEDLHTHPDFVFEKHFVAKDNLRYYFGTALKSEVGHYLGVLCVYHDKPLTLTTNQKEGFEALVDQIWQAVALKKAKKSVIAICEKKEAKLKGLHQELHSFTQELIAPTLRLKTAIDTFSKENGHLDPYLDTWVRDITKNANTLNHTLGGMLDHILYNTTPIDYRNFNLKDLIAKTKSKVDPNNNLTLVSEETEEEVYLFEKGLEFLFTNLFSNSVLDTRNGRYCKISYQKTETHHQIFYSDCGPNIKEHYPDQIFQMFYTRKNETCNQRAFGLATAKCLAERMNGSISIIEPVAKNSLTFKLQLPVI
ncbi:ATP-binding protein [Flavobacterium sp. ASW18X]|uniref:sensor histidine kinase n=1 Tax=Flavobacterium sp. ASW18X TaxID=2572595 RepID=UPI0010AED694|nr:ATP-binding protein [Flavobacterium sp. ASW18X]TKD66769.1 GAF domain-containing sensor histidine kinase [Flavobacterium sp. ASW18X]